MLAFRFARAGFLGRPVSNHWGTLRFAEPPGTTMIASQSAAAAAPGEALTPRLLLSLEDAAQALGLARRTLYNWSSSGRLPFPTVKLGGRRMVRVAELQAFVDGLASTPAATAPQPDPTPGLQFAPEPPRRRGRPRMAVPRAR
jgi:excisionase family DNA binding protein